MKRTYVSKAGFLAAVAVICGCSGSEAPKTPLGAAPNVAASESSSPGLTGQARIVLDSANLSFRAKAYDMALAQYRRSAELAPSEVAPLLGILMVADVTKNTALAAETLPRVRKLDPTMGDSAAISSHSKAVKAHPKGVPTPSPEDLQNREKRKAKT